MALGGVDFKDLMFVLKPAVGDVPAVAVKYGAFVNVVIDFLIVAFSIFMAIKAMSALKKKKEEAPAEQPKPSREEELLSEIRDLLKGK